MRVSLMLLGLTAGLLAGCGQESAPDAVEVQQDYAAIAARWIDAEFQPSTLNRDQQLEEMAWFTAAAEPFRGLEISVVSETLTTHEYESTVLTKAFEEITGINVTHDLIQEGDVIEKLQTQISRYDFPSAIITFETLLEQLDPESEVE